MNDELRIVLVDDDAVDRLALRRALTQGGVRAEILEADNAQAGLELLCKQGVSCGFVDFRLPGHDGLWLLAQARQRGVRTPLIVLTGQGDEQTAVEAMKAGACDYLSKAALSAERVAQSLRQALRIHQTEEALREHELERARLHEAERLARERAESESRMREELMAVVSHDLRNPLNSVMMSASLLSKTLPKDTPAQTLKFVQTITRSAERMARLISDLLDLAAIDRGALVVQPHCLAVATLLRESVELLQPVASESGLRLTSGPIDTELCVRGDKERLLQVLSNLLGNALKFTPRGGSIVVRAERCDDSVRFSVSDTGPGIPKAQLEHVFDRYFQSARDGRGIGLGLSIAKGIVDAHEGRIWVESEPGAGTTFYFTVPGARAESEASPAAARARPA